MNRFTLRYFISIACLLLIAESSFAILQFDFSQSRHCDTSSSLLSEDFAQEALIEKASCFTHPSYNRLFTASRFNSVKQVKPMIINGRDFFVKRHQSFSYGFSSFVQELGLGIQIFFDLGPIEDPASWHELSKHQFILAVIGLPATI